MRLKANFETTNVGDEYLLVPVGEQAASFHGVVTLTDAAAFVLKHLDGTLSMEQLADLLTDEYDVEKATALRDITALFDALRELELVEE